MRMWLESQEDLSRVPAIVHLILLAWNSQISISICLIELVIWVALVNQFLILNLLDFLLNFGEKLILHTLRNWLRLIKRFVHSHTGILGYQCLWHNLNTVSCMIMKRVPCILKISCFLLLNERIDVGHRSQGSKAGAWMVRLQHFSLILWLIRFLWFFPFWFFSFGSFV